MSGRPRPDVLQRCRAGFKDREMDEVGRVIWAVPNCYQNVWKEG